MMMRPPLFMYFSAACVAAIVPRTLMSITRSISSSVVSSNVFGMAVPALFTSTSSRPKVAKVFSTALLTAPTSAASAWIAIALPPSSSIALTTAEAALASFAYVMATLAPSAARRFAMAAPMPREPPVTSATLLASLDIGSPLVFLGQEHRDVPNKSFRVLVLRSVIGVRVEDQLRIGNVLLEDVRVDRVDDHVVVAVDDQRRLMDRLQIIEGVCARGAPLGECFELRRRHTVVHFGIAALGAPAEAFQIGAASCLAGFGWSEEDAEPQMVRRVVGSAENPLRFRSQRGHALAAARAGADQHQSADQLRRDKSQLLRHQAAEGEAEHVDLAETQRSDEGQRVGGHPFDRSRHLAGAAGDAGIVEQDDFAVPGEAVGHQRVPMVHGAAEMHVEDERHARGLAETAIGETDALGLDELRGCGLMGMSRHGPSAIEKKSGVRQEEIRVLKVRCVAVERPLMALRRQQSAGQRVALGEARGGAPVGEQLPGICRACDLRSS